LSLFHLYVKMFHSPVDILSEVMLLQQSSKTSLLIQHVIQYPSMSHIIDSPQIMQLFSLPFLVNMSQKTSMKQTLNKPGKRLCMKIFKLLQKIKLGVLLSFPMGRNLLEVVGCIKQSSTQMAQLTGIKPDL
jgi:hypothetical protein